METLSGPSSETASSTLAATTTTTTTTSTDRSTTTTNLTEEISSETTKEVVGIVTDVVPARKFGFISVLDRTATIGEHDSTKDHLSADGTNAPAPTTTTTASQQPRVKEKVFFHFSDVVASNHHHSEHKNNKSSSPVLIKKGDEVKMNIAVVSKTGAKKKRVAVNVTVVRRPAPASDYRREKDNQNNATKKNQHAPASGGGGESKPRSADLCQGWILMEPSYTSLGSSHRNTHKKISSTAADGDNHNKIMSPNSRWKTSDEDDGQLHATKSTTNEDGCILVLKDPNGYFSSSSSTTSSSGEDGTMKSDNKDDSTTGELENVDSNVSNKSTTTKQRLCQISYNKSDVHRMASTVHGTPPRRGDLVSFARSSKGGPKDVRVLKRGAARFVKGTLVHIDVERNKATFVMNSKGGATTEKSRPGKGSRKNNAPPPINIHLSDLVGCQGKVLNEGEPVEGMMVGGFLYGITRTKDLYIASTVTPPSSEGGSGGSTSTGERRRLNLTVKKELQSLGGKIIAQSSMAKGPDGTNGFADSWTLRCSLFPDGVLKEE